MKKVRLLAIVGLAGCLMVKAAAAQSLDDTLNKIGTTLGQTQKAISPANTVAMPTSAKPGQTISMPNDATVFSEPNENKPTSMRLPKGAPVVYQGTENGFAKIHAAGSTSAVFVPESTLQQTGAANSYALWSPDQTVNTTVSPPVNGAIQRGMETIKQLSHELENNPYVRLKGFNVSVSLMPSIEVEFEMKAQNAANGNSENKP